MALLSIIAANVISSVPGNAKTAIAGATITAGELIYLDTANNSVAKLVVASGTAIQAKVAGLALNSASAGQPVRYIAADANLQIGATGLTIGDAYFASTTPGGIGHLADNASGDNVTFVAIANSATTVNFAIVPSAGVKA